MYVCMYGMSKIKCIVIIMVSIDYVSECKGT